MSIRSLLLGSIHQGSIALELKMDMNFSPRLLKKEFRWDDLTLLLHLRMYIIPGVIIRKHFACQLSSP